jgi:hypothetical protein
MNATDGRRHDAERLVREVRAQTRIALAAVGLRLARSLAPRFAPDGAAPARQDEMVRALEFTQAYARQVAGALDASAGGVGPAHPLARLAALALPAAQAAMLADLLLLACLPEAHEGFATLCRLLHPDGLARPTGALALHWLESEAAPDDRGAGFAVRDAMEDLLLHGPAARLALLRLDGVGPWHARSLLPGAGAWEALMARAPRLDDAELVGGYAEVPGLADWLAEPATRQAVEVLRRGLPCQILLVGGDAAMRATRVRALLGAAPAVAVRARLDELGAADAAARAGVAHAVALLQRACLWFEFRGEADAGRDAPELPEQAWGATLVASARTEREIPGFGLPLVRLPVRGLAPVARRTLWRSLLPELGDQAALLAARYPVEPQDARDVVRDLRLGAELAPAADGAPPALDAIADAIRARTSWHARPGIARVTPRAGWDALLLPETARRALQSAAARVTQQITVLDDWGFAQGREERRGVRMLFFGSPGTGKTLAAEVMARALGVDLLVADLSSLVSKWLGETEKNLAAVFDVAERSRALLLFDEADALFAKRTDSQDAHDRYANLETAYLLQRLERYEGAAVLTTNLRANLDKAFSRRFEYIVEFPEPDAAAREALWRLHLPAAAPLAPDVDLAQLASWYPISGAQIKNAALAAAFLAATARRAMHQRHFLLAIEREYDKAGRAHPGYPPHAAPPVDEPDAAPSPARAHPDMLKESRT